MSVWGPAGEQGSGGGALETSSGGGSRILSIEGEGPGGQNSGEQGHTLTGSGSSIALSLQGSADSEVGQSLADEQRSC